MTNTNKQAEWDKALEKAKKIKDGLGMPIDKPMVETVAILNIFLNLNTTMSCGGHLDRYTGGPYILFEAPGTRGYQERYKKIADPVSIEHKQVIKEAWALNIRHRHELWKLLDEFYADRSIPNDQRIILRTIPFSNRIECQGADIARIMSGKEKEDLLMRSRKEMEDFTEFLKDIYFSN